MLDMRTLVGRSLQHQGMYVAQDAIIHGCAAL